MEHTYKFDDKLNITQLEDEIRQSPIIMAINSVGIVDGMLVVTFKSSLNAVDKKTLDGLVKSHEAIFIDETPKVNLGSATTYEGIPLVYATSKPIDHYVCFQGAGDSPDKIGGGRKVVFHLTSKDDVQSKLFTFNEDVYIKDGYIISRDAPFGASIDIEVLHPVYGIVVNTFGAEVPIFGTGWFPLDTEDRAFLPKGMPLRITVHNSRGASEDDIEEDEQSPADFWVSGRFEMYRKKRY